MQKALEHQDSTRHPKTSPNRGFREFGVQALFGVGSGFETTPGKHLRPGVLGRYCVLKKLFGLGGSAPHFLFLGKRVKRA